MIRHFKLTIEAWVAVSLPNDQVPYGMQDHVNDAVRDALRDKMCALVDHVSVSVVETTPTKDQQP